MSNIHIETNRLVTFHVQKVTRQTALNYFEAMEKAKTPFITVEKRNDNKYNVIGGFKYINGLRSLNRKAYFFCTIVDSFNSEKDRKLAILQRCLANNENIKYKEILIHELIQEFKMNEHTISSESGHDREKIKKYMYKQIIPRTYLVAADKLKIKPLVQAIYLANAFSPNEKRILTELSLEKLFKNKHIGLFKRYRKTYSLFEDFCLAKQQVLEVIASEQAIFEHWKNIRHPLS
ncbi:hypothetical protein [Peribacillus muralis]|uniref:hypothetical protein n=1 Tax=Peribacillus muralis TaxID=264697 RepID=UPI00366A83A6